MSFEQLELFASVYGELNRKKVVLVIPLNKTDVYGFIIFMNTLKK